MTYDPSMTITSTIPAPEGSDSTSREGKAIPLPVMAGGNASPAPDVPPPDMVKTVGGTTFDIYFHFLIRNLLLLDFLWFWFLFYL